MQKTASDEVTRLRAQLERMQGRRWDAPVLPVDAALADLLPGRGLTQGAAYSIGPSHALLFALMAAASQSGSWCGVIGMPELGAEAAAHSGMDLSRLVLIPDPGPRWLTVAATIADVLPLVAIRPSSRATAGDVSRLAARLRERGSTLLVQGPWPQAEATLEVAEARWSGLGEGWGVLAERELTVTVSAKRSPRPRRGRVLLPASNGRVEAARPVAPGNRPFIDVPQPLRAVG